MNTTVMQHFLCRMPLLCSVCFVLLNVVIKIYMIFFFFFGTVRPLCCADLAPTVSDPQREISAELGLCLFLLGFVHVCLTVIT